MRTRLPSAWVFFVLICCAALFATVLQKGLAFWQPLPQSVDWQGAQWIVYPSGTTQAYFRKTVNLPGRPDRAWLTIAALDGFELYVNGTLAGRADYLGARMGAMYDLSRLLVSGRNVIAVSTTSMTKGLPAQMIGKLEWELAGNRERHLTDTSWRVESRLRRSGQGSILWSENAYQDMEWPQAQTISTVEVDHLIPQLELPLDLARVTPRGFWIWSDDSDVVTASFSRVLEIEQPFIRQAWMGVSAEGVFLISVNGMLLGPISGSETRMDLINLAPYLSQGRNMVHIQVTGASWPMRIAAIGILAGQQGMTDFSSDSRWTTAPDGGRVETVSSFLHDFPAITLAPDFPQHDLMVHEWGRFLSYFSLLLLAMFVAGMLFTQWQRTPGNSCESRWEQYAQPFVVVSVVIALVIFADADPRFELGWSYAFWLPAGAMLLLGTWLAWLVLISAREAKVIEERTG